MPSINMIAGRRSEKKRLESNLRRLALVVLAEIAIAIVLGGAFTVRICSARTRTGDLDVQLAKLQPAVKKIEYYENETTKLKPKLELLSNAKTSTLRWSDLMDELSEVLPGGTWLTRMATAADATTPQQAGAPAMVVNLNGVSPSQNQVGEAMLRLNSYRDFQRVDLHYTQKTMIGQKPAVEFEIAAALKTGGNAGKGTSNAVAKS